MGLYHNSYLCIRGFLAPDETSGLLDRAKELLDGFDINDHPMVRGLCYTCVRLSLYTPCSLFFVFYFNSSWYVRLTVPTPISMARTTPIQQHQQTAGWYDSEEAQVKKH